MDELLTGNIVMRSETSGISGDSRKASEEISLLKQLMTKLGINYSQLKLLVINKNFRNLDITVSLGLTMQ